MEHENVCYLKLVRLNEDVILKAISIKKRRNLGRVNFLGFGEIKIKCQSKLFQQNFIKFAHDVTNISN